MSTLTRPWRATVECRRHRFEYEYVCNCTDPDWCDCDECPLCHQEDAALEYGDYLRKQEREEPHDD